VGGLSGAGSKMLRLSRKRGIHLSSKTCNFTMQPLPLAFFLQRAKKTQNAGVTIHLLDTW